ncbi:hypothetical protein Tco_0835315 [Tanacetum coccineum]
MTTSNDGFNGVACGKTFRKKVLPHDQPAIAITNSNPNNTSKSGFLSRLIYLVTCAFWKRNPEEASITVILFTTYRYDIEHLKKSLHLRTTRSDVGEGDKANIYNNSHVLRLKASISGPLNKHTVKGIKPISIPRPTTSLMIPLNQLVTFRVKLKARRSRSSVLYDLGSGGPMHRIRPKANLFHPSARKRRSSVLDDLGSGGPMRRIWQKANLCSQGSSLSERKSEFVSSALNLLLCSEPERKASKAIVENGKTSMRNSGYAFVPTQSTQMASKILEHLERTSPKEKNSSSRVAGTTEKSANFMIACLPPQKKLRLSFSYNQ